MPDIYFHEVTNIEINKKGGLSDAHWMDIVIHTPEGSSEISLFASDKRAFDIVNRHLTTTDEEADQMEANT